MIYDFLTQVWSRLWSYQFSLFSCLLAVPRPRRVAPDEAKWKNFGPTFIILWVLRKSLIPSKNMLLKVNWDKHIIGFSSAQRLESTNPFFVNIRRVGVGVEVETYRSSVRRKVRHSRGQGHPTTFLLWNICSEKQILLRIFYYLRTTIISRWPCHSLQFLKLINSLLFSEV